MERRDVLILLVCGGSAAVATVVGVPALIYAVAPAGSRRGEADWRDVGRLDEFPVGEITDAMVHPAAEATDIQSLRPGVYVWRRTAEEVVVFSRSCTDLGCPVTFDRGSHCFLCPCHGGIFDQQGERMAGPPDRPLYRYENRARDGVLQVNVSSVPPMV